MSGMGVISSSRSWVSDPAASRAFVVPGFLIHLTDNSIFSVMETPCVPVGAFSPWSCRLLSYVEVEVLSDKSAMYSSICVSSPCVSSCGNEGSIFSLSVLAADPC